MNGAELIAATLEGQSIGSVFSVAGASHAHLLNALQSRGVRIVSSRHESGCVSAADGYARIRRHPGVALLVGDQGLPNAIGGLAAAHAANSPVLLLVALPPQGLMEAHAFHDTRKLALLESITKCARVVADATDLAGDLRDAIETALSGRPGPVALALPADVVTSDAGAASLGVEVPLPAVPDSHTIEQAAQRLGAARRPLIIAGAGAYWADAGSALHRLAEQSGIPIAANGIGRGVVAEDNATVFSWPFAQLAANQADCVLLVGMRLTQRLGFGLPPRFAADAHFIQIDVEPHENNRVRPIDTFIQADATVASNALADAMANAGTPRRGWLREALAPRFAALDQLDETTSAGVHPLALGRALAQRLPADAIYVGDGADIQSWMYGAIRIHQAPGFIDHYPSGSMGIGTPLAVGAAVAAADAGRRRKVLLVTGDGAFGFQPAELHAAALAGLDLIVIIGNDGAWGTEVYDQQRSIGTDINTRLGQLAYEKIAEGFGCTGLRVSSANELGSALDQAFAHDGPIVVNVMIDPNANAAMKIDDRLRMIMFSDAPG